MISMRLRPVISAYSTFFIFLFFWAPAQTRPTASELYTFGVFRSLFGRGCAYASLRFACASLAPLLPFFTRFARFFVKQA